MYRYYGPPLINSIRNTKRHACRPSERFPSVRRVWFIRRCSWLQPCIRGRNRRPLFGRFIDLQLQRPVYYSGFDPGDVKRISHRSEKRKTNGLMMLTWSGHRRSKSLRILVPVLECEKCKQPIPWHRKRHPIGYRWGRLRRRCIC